MHDLNEELDGGWIRSLMSTEMDRIGAADGAGGLRLGAVSREQALAAGRARLVRRRVSVGTALAVAVVLAVAGYVVSGASAGAHDGPGAVVASTASSPQQGRDIGTAARMSESSPTPSAF